MDFLDDLRDSRTLVGKVFLSVTFLVLFAFLALLAISGFALVRTTAPERSGGTLDPNQLLVKPDLVNVAIPGGGSLEGWFFPGLRTAPTIVLCHGYRSQRSDILTMVTPLQEHQYNVFVFDFPGHGGTAGKTTLGPSEAKVVLAAVDELSRRTDLDAERFGLWGVDMGGYAAMAAAAADSRIKAVAVDNVYDAPSAFLRLQIERTGLGAVPLVNFFTGLGYTVMNWSQRNEPPVSELVARMSQTAKLFIQGRGNEPLANATLQLFLRAPEPRQQAVLQHATYSSMPDEEKREYENQLLNFFLLNLPTAAPPPAR
jgi:pimeloyl-ACP methyl ester carboxylesterase